MITRRYRSTRLLLLFLYLCVLQVSANHKLQTSNFKFQTFRPPVDYDISLAGNFGEPRPHHFHGGLDIRTGNVEGKHVYAIGDGYVSRVTCGLYGFGNAVYVTHPSGLTSVYCHLRSFSPRIKATMRRYQYARQSSVADVRFTPLDVPVAQGQYIALSGNTGHSFGPHLHLEIHDTETWDMLDPYEFLADYINDSLPPRAHSLMACPQAGGGVFCGSTQKQVIGIPQQEQLLEFETDDAAAAVTIDRELTAWGPVGFALWADDYMQGSTNHYGVRETVLAVDGREVFHAVVNRVPMECNRQVNAWGDYDRWLQTRAWFMKSYAEPGCTLDFLWTDARRGIVVFDEDRPYLLEYTLSDYKGNQSRYRFVVKGRPTPNPSLTGRGDVTFSTNPSPPSQGGAGGGSLPSRSGGGGGGLFPWNRTNSYSLPGMQLVVPYGLLARDTELRPAVSRQPGQLSDVYTYADHSVPLMRDAELSIYARRPVSDVSKLYLTDSEGHYLGGDYRDGWVTGHVLELAAHYRLAYDDQPPAVRLVAASGHQLLVAATDAQSGIASWTATIDGRFVVFDAVEKTANYACTLAETWLRPTGRSHRLVFTATDNRQNSQTLETSFVY